MGKTFNSVFMPGRGRAGEHLGVVGALYNMLTTHSDVPLEGVVFIGTNVRLPDGTGADLLLYGPNIGILPILVLSGSYAFNLETGTWDVDGVPRPDMARGGPFDTLVAFSRGLAAALRRAGLSAPVNPLAWLPDTPDTAVLDAPATVSLMTGRDRIWKTILETFDRTSPLLPEELDAGKLWSILFPAIPFPENMPEAATEDTNLVSMKAAEDIPSQAISQMRTFERLLLKCINQAVGSKPIYYCGVQVATQDIASPDYFLPALMVCASLRWGPVVSRRGSKTAFKVFLSTDQTGSYPVGYSVSGILLASVTTCFVPCISVLKECDRGTYVTLDPVALEFKRWLDRHGYDTSALDFLEEIVEDE